MSTSPLPFLGSGYFLAYASSVYNLTCTVNIQKDIPPVDMVDGRRMFVSAGTFTIVKTLQLVYAFWGFLGKTTGYFPSVLSYILWFTITINNFLPYGGGGEVWALDLLSDRLPNRKQYPEPLVCLPRLCFMCTTFPAA